MIAAEDARKDEDRRNRKEERNEHHQEPRPQQAAVRQREAADEDGQGVPGQPAVEKIEREFTARDLAYCDMQGNIFMAAVDQGIAMRDFAPIFMNSQLAGVIDYSFSRAGGMEEDDIANYLRMPMLLKSPAIIVDTVMWLNEIVSRMNPGDNLNMAVVNALEKDEPAEAAARDSPTSLATDLGRSDVECAGRRLRIRLLAGLHLPLRMPHARRVQPDGVRRFQRSVHAELL